VPGPPGKNTIAGAPVGGCARIRANPIAISPLVAALRFSRTCKVPNSNGTAAPSAVVASPRTSAIAPAGRATVAGAGAVAQLASTSSDGRRRRALIIAAYSGRAGGTTECCAAPRSCRAARRL
jgi:hypothetical protein